MSRPIELGLRSFVIIRLIISIEWHLPTILRISRINTIIDGVGPFLYFIQGAKFRLLKLVQELDVKCLDFIQIAEFGDDLL